MNPLVARHAVEKLDRAALLDRYEAFVQMVPERIPILEAIVRGTQNFEDWRPDSTPESVGRLASWLVERVTTRQRTPEEMDAIKQTLRLPVRVSDRELSEQTLSFVYDIAMYFAAALCRQHPHLRWSIILKDRRNVDYGQPVLIGFPKGVPLNPVQVVANVAYSVVRGTAKFGRLESAFRVWNEQANRSSRVH